MSQGEPNWNLLALSAAAHPSGARLVSALMQGWAEKRRRAAEAELGGLEDIESQSYESPEDAYKRMLGYETKTGEGRRARNEALGRTYKRYGEYEIARARVPDQPAETFVPPALPEELGHPGRAAVTQAIPVHPDAAMRAGREPRYFFSDAQARERAAGRDVGPPFPAAPFGDRSGETATTAEIEPAIPPTPSPEYSAKPVTLREATTRRPTTLDELRSAIPNDAAYRAAIAAHSDLIPKQYAPTGVAALTPAQRESVNTLADAAEKRRAAILGALAENDLENQQVRDADTSVQNALDTFRAGGMTSRQFQLEFDKYISAVRAARTSGFREREAATAAKRADTRIEQTDRRLAQLERMASDQEKRTAALLSRGDQSEVRASRTEMLASMRTLINAYEQEIDNLRATFKTTKPSQYGALQKRIDEVIAKRADVVRRLQTHMDALGDDPYGLR